MAARPFFKKSIAELEVAFANGRKDREVRHQLLHELGFRNTQRALALKEKVLAANDDMAADIAVPPQTRQKTEPPPRTNDAPPRQEERICASEQVHPAVKPGPKPPVTNAPQNILRTWTALAPESLGWLLVDEAGQAVPQAAVGAMLRTKRAVVVGDPLQIEPVVTLPNSLTEEVCAFFGVDPLKYNAPEASVQTVADAASLYCARFPIGSGHRDVGAPLLVHRRCDSPMFDISNEIA